MAKKKPWNYQPVHKVGTLVMAKQVKSIATIVQIDNECNVRDNNSAMPEYYLLWPRDDAFTRHDCDELDRGDATVGGGFNQQELIVLSKAGQILYGSKNTKGRKSKKSKVRHVKTLYK